ncbi:MAG: energy transducer TonB [Acidobacteriota bacterium]
MIDKQGDVRCLDVVQGLPMGLTDQALNAVRRWKFEPASLHGEPKVVRYNITINVRGSQ